MNLDINWDRVRSDAFTRIRAGFPIEKVIHLANSGSETPVSGDVIADLREEGRL